MADERIVHFTYIIPPEYKHLFPGLDGNQLYVPAFKFEEYEDQLQSAQESLVAAGIPETALPLAGGPQNIKIGTSIAAAKDTPSSGGAFKGKMESAMNVLGKLPAFQKDQVSDKDVMQQGKFNESLIREEHIEIIRKDLRGLPNIPTNYFNTAPALSSNAKVFNYIMGAEGTGGSISPTATGEATDMYGQPIVDIVSDPGGANVGLVNDGTEAVNIQKNPAVEDLPKSTKFNEAYVAFKKSGKSPTVTYQTEYGPETVLHPELAIILELSAQQDGWISDAQLVQAQHEGRILELKQQAINEQAIAFAQNRSDNYRANLQATTDKALADAQLKAEEARFAAQQEIETARFNLQSETQQLQFDQQMEQMRLADLQRWRDSRDQRNRDKYEFDLLFAQNEAEATATAAAFEQQKIQDDQQFQLQMDQQAKALKAAEFNVNLQMERDRITAETNKEIAEIERLTAGDTAEANRRIAERRSEEAEKLAELEQATILGTGAQQLQATLAGFEAQELQATETAAAQRAAAESARLGQEAAATSAAGAQIAAAQSAAAAASPFGFLAQPLPEGLTPEQREALLLERQNQLAAIQQQQFNPFDLSTQEFQNLSALQARAGATPFGAITTAPTEGQTYTDLLELQQAQAAQGPFQAAQLGQEMADIGTIQRGGLTPEQQLALAQAPGNPFGLTAQQQIDLQATLARGGNTAIQQQTLAESLARGGLSVEQQLALAGLQARGGLSAEQQSSLAGMQARGGITDEQSFINLQNQLARGGLTATEQSALAGLQARGGITDENEFMALQQSLARGGLTPAQRLAEVQASAAPQNMANYLNFIGNPSAVGFAAQSGMLQNIADSPEGNIPASLFGLNVPQNTPAVPTNPTMADLTDLTDEQLGFYQGQMAAQNYQTPSQIFQQAQTVTPQGV
jgi:hypothetical protein